MNGDRRSAPAAAPAADQASEHAARMRPPAAVRHIAEVLEAAGHETWCVGGAVRDALLGVAHLDWDLATAATPQQVRRLFRRTVPVGIEFGTVGVLDDDGRMHEVTTFRRDVHTDGRHAVVEFGASLDEDLARRDFTINAIAFSSSRGVLHDPFGGRDDLARGIVRAVGNPQDRMREDRLRALRAIRFAARFGFELEPATRRAIDDSAPHLGRLSPERVKQELDKTLEQVSHAGAALALWRDANALRSLVPSLADVSPAALGALDCLPRATGRRAAQRRIVRYAALFADVAAGALGAELKALRFSRAESRAVLRLVQGWRAIGPEVEAALVPAGRAPAGAEVRRWISQAGRSDILPLLRLASARWRARRSEAGVAPAPADVHRLYRAAARSAYRDPVTVADLAIGGEALKRIGVPPGPQMARILHRLLALVLEDPARNTVARLLADAAAMAPVGPGDSGPPAPFGDPHTPET